MNCFTRFFRLPVMLVALLLSVGCGAEVEGDRNAGTDAPAAADDVRPVIGVSLPAAAQGWHAGALWWAEQTVASYDEIDWRLEQTDGAEEQVAQLAAMVDAGVDALVLLPMDSSAPLDVVRQAKDEGVYVVSVDRGLREPEANLHIVGDNAAFGRISAEFIVEQLDFQGRVVILRGVPGAADTERYDAATSVFDAHPGIEVIDAQPGHGDQDDAREVMQAWLGEYDQIDAVWAPEGAMALGVEEAIRAAGRADEMWIVSGAGMSEIVARVMDDDPLYRADVTYSPAMIAAAIHLAVAEVLYDGDEQAVADRLPDHLGIEAADLLGSTEPRSDNERRLTLPAILVTPENAKDYYLPDSAY